MRDRQKPSHIQTQKRRHIQTDTYRDAHNETHTNTKTQTHIQKHIQRHIDMHTQTNACMHARGCVRTHTHTHTYTRTHAHPPPFFQKTQHGKAISHSFARLTFQDKLVSDLDSQSETICLRVDFLDRSLGICLAMGRTDPHDVLETMEAIPVSQTLDT